VTVTNYGTIAGTVAIDLANASDRLIAEAGSTFDGEVVATGGTLEFAGGSVAFTAFVGFDQIVIDAGASGDLDGSINLTAGETLTNSGSLALTGKLANAGLIAGVAGAAASSSGQAGGIGNFALNIAASGTLTSTGQIVGGAGGAGFDSAATPGGGGRTAIGMTGGSLVNNAGGTVTGGQGGKGGSGSKGAGPGGVGGAGVTASGAATVTNAGLIAGGAGGTGNHPESVYVGGSGGVGGVGVYLADGARLTNTGTVSGGLGGAGGYYGATQAASGIGVRIRVGTGGNVVNGSASVKTALIQGRVGVYAGSPATVTNYGTIAGTGGTSVRFTTASDRLIAEAGSTFVGKVVGGGGTLQLAGGTGTITGLGGAAATLSGAEAMNFSGFGAYQTGAGGNWTLAGNNNLAAAQTLLDIGVLTLSGSLLNAGLIRGGAGAAARSDDAVGGVGDFALNISATGVLTSTGQIIGGVGGAGFNGGATASAGGGGRTAVGMTGGSLVNNAGGTIAGGQGGKAGSSGKGAGAGGLAGAGLTASGAATVTNAGLIAGGAGGTGGYLSSAYTSGQGGGGGVGVYLANGARLTNTGTVSGGLGGAGGSSGAPQGLTGIGVRIRPGTGDNVFNGAASVKTALIRGRIGVYAVSPATITNFGTIQGTTGTSVYFKSASDRLIAEAGSTFIGKVIGGGGTLELGGGTGTITGLGGAVATLSGAEAMSFSGFNRIGIDAGTAWTLSGANVRGAGQSVVSLGSLVVNGSFGGAGALVIAGGTATFAAGAKLTLATVTQDAGTAAIDTNLSFGGAWAQTAGAISVASGETLTLTGSGDVFSGPFGGGGALAITGAGVAFNAGAVITIAKVSQSGASNVTVGGAVTCTGTWVQSAGTISVGAGRTFTFSSAGDVFRGALAGAGTVAFSGGSDTLSNASLSGHVAVTGAKVTLAGTIANSGTITDTAGRLFVDAAGVTLTGGGDVNLAGAATNTFSGASAFATLTNIDNLIQGGGLLGYGNMVLTNAAAGRIIGDMAAALIINTGANTIVNAGTITASAGGGVEIKSQVANTGALIAMGATLTLDQAVTGAGTARIADGILDAAGAFSENVAFTGTTGKLELADSQGYLGSVTGFSHAGTTSLDLRDIAFASGTKATFTGGSSGGTLTVTDGAHTAKIKLIGNYVGTTFAASADGSGGTTITDSNSPAAVHAFVAAMAATGGAAGSSFTPTQSAPQPQTVLTQPRP